jgi:hypothetical protein
MGGASGKRTPEATQNAPNNPQMRAKMTPKCAICVAEAHPSNLFFNNIPNLKSAQTYTVKL